MATLIITEKSSQAKDLRAALGDRYGRILPAEGHLLRLAEPDEVDPAWKRWSPTLLKPDGLFPTRPDQGGNKAAKLQAITAALRACDEVILATDCDREGQLIGQEILEHVGYRGKVRRALFTAQDPKTLRDAFAALKSNDSMRPLYEAAVARQQADQIYNLSLTRTATKTLLAPGTRGVIGIGRVKTPTLAIVCLRELEIRNFKPEDYFEVVATATVAEGSFLMRHAPAPKDRIKDRAAAEAIARAADNHRGPLTVTVEEKRQAPPKLYDLPSLQKTCGQRWGWTADRTLAVAQELYDGEGKKLITYPRAEARYLSENQIADAPAIVGALTRLRGFAHLDIARPVIRKGKSGHFCDKALEGVSHHAVIPNVNVLDDLESRLVRLTDDEKRLFALICRSYLAAVMPDYEYRQTSVTMPVPVPSAGGGKPVTFRAVGRIPLKLGWKAAFGSAESDDRSGGKAEEEAEQTLPPLTDGELATLSDPKVEAKRTQAPPRYNEGTLVDAMQNAWRFVEDPALRDRLKEAKGIGTPATRAEVIKGLRKQNLLGADGKWLVPTPAGLHLFETLRAAAPTLVDPGTTALWEMKLDEVVTGRADFRHVIDAIASEADRLIGALIGQRGATLDLGLPAVKVRFARRGAAGRSTTTRGGAAVSGDVAKPARRRTRKIAAPAEGDAAAPKPRRTRKTKGASSAPPAAAAAESAPAEASPIPESRRRREPTERMVAFARSLAERKGIALPDPCLRDFDQCRSFLDQHAR
ncbi:DNA topoisomerase III [Azospirillum sp. TSH7]|uniref:DNA topoisomerase n=1 Tax=unclassified Azospirillum TaxID=2630922 RepID=UPI000D61AF13|nr:MULTISPECIES: DNA topoisomerase [unclassified Azospirillum]PWC58390.1 DNA topoisomerase III [Azospirillum sp. TSH7]PWC70402.1 DNA topoisomerase III [Azospirillum sp. TSH20]